MQTVNEAQEHLNLYYTDEDSAQYGPIAWANGVRVARLKLSAAKAHAERFGLDDDGKPLEDKG